MKLSLTSQHKFFLSVIGLCLGGVIVLLGFFFLLSSRQKLGAEVGLPESSFSPSSNSRGLNSTKGTFERLITVEIQGAVIHPGVYEVAENTRVVSLVQKAGGFSRHVDRDWLNKNFNQAQVLQDGDKIYVELLGEKTETKSTQSVSAKKAPAKKKSTKKVTKT